MKKSSDTLLPEVAEHFALKGYTPGPMVLATGRTVDFRTLPLVDVERIFKLGIAAPWLVKLEVKVQKEKKKKTDKPEESDSSN